MSRKTVFSVLTAVFLMGTAAVSVGTTAFADSSQTVEVSVAKPTANKSSGTKTCTGSTCKVKLSCKTEGAEIYYSVGGDYQLYTGEIALTENAEIKTYAVKNGIKSDVAVYNYKLKPYVKISVKGGRYYSVKSVKLSSTVEGVEFYYTLDGSEPTTSSEHYTDKIRITKSCTLRIIACKDGWTESSSSYDYTIASKNYSLLNNTKGKYYYQSLNYNEKQAYEKILKDVTNFSNYIDLSEFACKSNEKIFYAVKYDNPQIFWLDKSFTVSDEGITPKYTMKKSESSDVKKMLTEEAEKISKKALEESDIQERAKIIQTELCAKVKYDSSNAPENSEVYGALIYGRANSEGYAKAYAYIAQLSSIDAVCIDGFADMSSHCWNMIRINNKWLHVDTALDDHPVGDECFYSYFCVKDAAIGSDHVTNTTLSYPSSISYNERTAKTEFNKIIKAVRNNYLNKIYVTEYTTKYKPTGGLLKYIYYNLNSGVKDAKINMRPWFSYEGNKFVITLK